MLRNGRCTCSHKNVADPYHGRRNAPVAQTANDMGRTVHGGRLHVISANRCWMQTRLFVDFLERLYYSRFTNPTHRTQRWHKRHVDCFYLHVLGCKSAVALCIVGALHHVWEEGGSPLAGFVKVLLVVG